VKVLGDDAKALTIQVGADDGQTITIELAQINQTTLNLDGFNIGATSDALKTISLTDADGITHTAEIALDLSNVPAGLDATKFTLHGYGEFDADSGLYDAYALKDENGVMYKVANTAMEIDPTSTTATFGTFTFDFTDADTAKAAADDYDADVKAGLASTANPLDALDKALQQVDDL